MNFMVRPSKSFLYDLLEKELFSLRGEVGLDAASANLNNRRMFRTKYYYGLDFDIGLLKRGLEKYREPNIFGIHADMVNLSAIADNSVDAVVSTNTLHQMPQESRKLALAELCRICSPKGKLLCEMPLDTDFDALLKMVSNHFSEIKIYYYSNPVSRFYESIFEQDGFLGSHPVAGRRPFRVLAWLISRLEFLTRKVRSINRRVFIAASQKRGSHAIQKFDLSHLPVVNGRIFEMLKND